MKFELTHLDFPHISKPEYFTESNPPSWIAQWFLDDHVFKLKVGQEIDTDFRKIRRLL